MNFLFPGAWRVLGLAVVIIAGLGYVGYLRASNAALRGDVARLERTAAVQAMALAQTRHALTVAADDAERTLRRNVDARLRREEIRNAPTIDDGPVAPVLRRALDGLRGSPG